MTVEALLQEMERLGIVLAAAGDRLQLHAPKGILTAELHAALRTHKAELLRRLAAPPPDALGEPCAACGTKEKWRWLDGRLLCRACLLREVPASEASRPRPQVRRREPWIWPTPWSAVER